MTSAPSHRDRGSLPVIQAARLLAQTKVETSARIGPRARAGSQRHRILTTLFASLAVLLIAHDVDHIVHEGRLGTLSTAFYVFFVLQVSAYVAVIALLLRGNAIAPLAAGIVATLALIVLAGAHLTSIGPLPYADADPAAVSWLLLFVPLAFAAATLLTAFRLLGRRPG